MKLYFAPRTRAVRARWLLEELGAPYELARLDLSREDATPSLVDGDVTLRDSLAICLHLADRFPERHLAPAPGSPERGAYYHWMVFAETQLDSAVMALLPQATAHLQDGLATQPRARLTGVLDTLREGLCGRRFLVGERFSAADVVTASLLHLAHSLKLLDGHPHLVDYTSSHTRRPAVRRAVAE
ncbi:glutathione S-transferase family protein [Myxococcus fulvus]|uniref:glutathione S-transferase family protein n=1 Tax=Myxococcus fulvus TaxID=33 RepID=UPI003B9A3C72